MNLSFALIVRQPLFQKRKKSLLCFCVGNRRNCGICGNVQVKPHQGTENKTGTYQGWGGEDQSFLTAEKTREIGRFLIQKHWISTNGDFGSS